LRRSDFSDLQKLNRLIGAGVLAVLLGFAWGLQFPVVKKIWTSSFVLVAGGWSLLLLAAFYYIIDMRQWQRWCVPFLWIGMNPITLYMSTALIDYDAVARHFVGGDVVHFFDQVITPGFGTFVVALASLACVLLLARFLFTRKIFIRV
jgi:predicted acyltransferase